MKENVRSYFPLNYSNCNALIDDIVHTIEMNRVMLEEMLLENASTGCEMVISIKPKEHPTIKFSTEKLVITSCHQVNNKINNTNDDMPF